MPVSRANINQRKTIGRTFHNNAVAIALLQWCLCSSIIMCIGASTSTPTQTQTIITSSISNPSTHLTATTTTANTITVTTDITSTPTEIITSIPTTDITSTPTAIITSIPTTDVTSTPTAITTSIPTTDVTSTPTTDITSTPTAIITSIPTTDVTSTPTAIITSIPTTDVTSTPTAIITSIPTTDITSTPTAIITSIPTTDITSTSTTDITSTPTTDITSTSTTDITRTPNTNNPSAKVTTSPAKSDRPPYFPMPTGQMTENKDITLKLQVKLVSGNFSESLNDPSSPFYQEIQINVTNELTSAFNKSPAFLNITVTGFWNGSIGVNFISYYQDTNLRDIISQRDSTLHDLASGVFNVTLLEQTFNESISNELQSICNTSDSCPMDYRCSVNNIQLEPYCEHLFLCHQLTCQSNAYCVVSESNQAACKCVEDDDYVYSGANCETKTEKLTMSKDKIIGIAAGVGGGVILLLVLAIVIISMRQRQTKRSREENIIDNASEQSFQSFKGAEDGTHQPTSSSEYITATGRGHSMYRLPEERAENPKFNPYLSLPNVQPASRQQDFSQGFLPAPERTRESSRNIQAKTQQFQERVPNYGDPVQIPRFQVDLHGSDYMRTDNKRAQSSVSKTANTRRENRQGGPLHSPAEAKVYDYSNDMELMASGAAHPLNDTDLYDFSYENQLNVNARQRNRHLYDSPYERNVKQPDEINDPYSVQRRLV